MRLKKGNKKSLAVSQWKRNCRKNAYSKRENRKQHLEPMKNSNIKRLMIAAASILCLGATAFAGPAPKPMYIMISGAMYEITAFTGDVALGNGCKVCMDGTVIT